MSKKADNVVRVTLPFTRDFHVVLKYLAQERSHQEGHKCTLERFCVEALEGQYAHRRRSMKKPSELVRHD